MPLGTSDRESDCILTLPSSVSVTDRRPWTGPQSTVHLNSPVEGDLDSLENPALGSLASSRVQLAAFANSLLHCLMSTEQQ